MVAPAGAPLRRRPMATGAVQHEHIMLGRASSAPLIPWPHVVLRFNTRSNHRLGTRDSRAAATNNATSAAFHTAVR